MTTLVVKRTIMGICTFLLAGEGLFSQNARYYKTQMHTHSTVSDGKLTPVELATAYRDKGYEILFITDHNKVAPADSVNVHGISCFNGQEYTFSKHINGYFVNHSVDAVGFTSQQAVDTIKSHDGLAMFNHPVNMKYGPDWSFPINYFSEDSRPDFIEIYNASTSIFAPIDIGIWDYLLSQNYRIYGVASDDLHNPIRAGIEMIDRGWVMLKLCTLIQDSVYAALKRGDFYSSTGVNITEYIIDGNAISISCDNCSRIRFIGNNGLILEETQGQTASYTRVNEKYIRIELEDNGIIGLAKKRAWTNPMFFNNLSDEQLAETPLTLNTYPNPFNSHLNISYSIPGNSHVKLQLLDYSGKEVALLVNEYQSADSYDVSFENMGLNSGIYYCKLTVNNQFKTAKVIITN